MRDKNIPLGRGNFAASIAYCLSSIGFEFAGCTDLHYRADDELLYEVGRRAVTGKTDRFTMLFRKP
jgi:predicted methyltransferase